HEDVAAGDVSRTEALQQLAARGLAEGAEQRGRGDQGAQQALAAELLQGLGDGRIAVAELGEDRRGDLEQLRLVRGAVDRGGARRIREQRDLSEERARFQDRELTLLTLALPDDPHRPLTD